MSRKRRGFNSQPEAISTKKENELLVVVPRVASIEKKTEAAHVPISKTVVTELVTECLAHVLEAMVAEPVTEPLALGSEAVVTGQQVELRILVLETVAIE